MLDVERERCRQHMLLQDKGHAHQRLQGLGKLAQDTFHPNDFVRILQRWTFNISFELLC